VLIERKSVRNLSGLITEKERKKLYKKLRTINKKIKIDPQSCAMELERFHMELLNKLQEKNLRMPMTEIETTEHGYEIFNGIGWQPTIKWKNWERTLTNIRNLAKELKRKDKDARGIVAGQRGLGKTTFSLRCIQHIVNETNHDDEISRENFVMNLEDIKNVRDEGTSPYLVDEILTLLNAKRAMSNENVETEEILSKMRWRNTFGFWNTTQLQTLSETHLKEFDFVVYVFSEGKFKFFSKNKLSKFNKTSGTWDLPDCDFIGNFPPLKDELWEWYSNEIEPNKDKTRKELREQKKNKKKEEERVSCSKCGYQWTPRKDTPARCPSCSSRNWNEDDGNTEQDK